MPKISQSLGFTLRIGNFEDNQYARVGIEVREIDTDLPMETQLNKVKESLEALWPVIYKAVNSEVVKVTKNGS